MSISGTITLWCDTAECKSYKDIDFSDMSIDAAIRKHAPRWKRLRVAGKTLLVCPNCIKRLKENESNV